MFFFSFLLLTTMAAALTPFPTNPTSVAKPQLIEDVLKDVPRGVRFAPRPEELICDLLEKNKDHNHTILTMPVVNLNEVEPWDAINMTKKGEDCYLLWKHDNRYSTGSRICRTTERGYWKSTGNDTGIYSSKEEGSKLVGVKKNLVFHLGRAPDGKNTKWVMKEFRVESRAFPDLPAQNPWVVVLITYSGEHNGQERVDPSVLRDLTAITSSMEPSGRLEDSITIPVRRDGASGCSVPHPDVSLLPPLVDVFDSHDIPIKALKAMNDLPEPKLCIRVSYEDSQAEQPPLKKMKTMPVLPEAVVISDSPTSVLEPDSHFSSRETMHEHDFDQSSSEIADYISWLINEAPPILEDCK